MSGNSLLNDLICLSGILSNTAFFSSETVNLLTVRVLVPLYNKADIKQVNR